MEDIENKWSHLLLQKHYKKLFLLMNGFWNEIRDFNFDLKWLFKVRSNPEKLERKLQETERKN